MEELSLPEFENYPDILSRIQDAITTGISIEHDAIIVKDINTLYNLILQSNPEAKLTGRYNKTHTEKRADRITIPNNNGIFYIEKNADGSTIGMSVNSKVASLEREVRHIAEIDSHGYERHLSFSRSSKVGRDSTLISVHSIYPITFMMQVSERGNWTLKLTRSMYPEDMKCNIEAVHMPNLGEVDAWFHWNERMELTGYQNGLLINEGYPGVHITNGILTFNSNQGMNRQISIPLEFDIAGHLNHLGIDLN